MWVLGQMSFLASQAQLIDTWYKQAQTDYNPYVNEVATI